MQWLVNLMEVYGKIRIADEAKNLNDNAKVLKADRAVVDAHHRKYLGENYKPEAVDDDMIHIGDRIEHHHQPASKLPTWLIVLALTPLTGALGFGTGLLIHKALTKSTPPPTIAPQRPQDSDTQFRLQLEPAE